MKILTYADKNFWKILGRFARPQETSGDVSDIVAKVIDTVRNRGDAAVAEYTKKFDGVEISELLEPNSLIEKTAYAENFLKNAKVEDKFQFMRKGYYCLDKDTTKDNYIFNSTISLRDSFKRP